MTRRRARLAATLPHCTVVTPIALPADWSPEQAVAVFELIDELRERVWAHYGPHIQQFLREQRSTATPSASGDIDDTDVPF